MGKGNFFKRMTLIMLFILGLLIASPVVARADELTVPAGEASFTGKDGITYYFTYEIGDVNKITSDNIANRAVITGIELPADMSVNIPVTVNVVIPMDAINSLNPTRAVTKDVTAVFQVVGLGEIREMNLWDKFTQAFRDLFNIDDSLFIGDYKPTIKDGTTGACTLTIPKYVETIGNNAFHGQSGITAVVFNNSANLTEIGAYSFSGINIPTLTLNMPKLTSIPDNAFSDILALKTVSATTSVVSYIGENAFAGCITLTDFKMTKGSSCDLYIEESAFAGDVAMTSFELGGTAAANLFGTVQLGGPNIFKNIQLNKVTLHCTAIEDNGAFHDMSSLDTLTFSNWTSIPDSIFKGCTGIGRNTATQDKEQRFDEDGNPEIGDDGNPIYDYVITAANYNMVIPKTVEFIGQHAFEGCTAIGKVTFAAGSVCTSIGDSAFEGCEFLNSIVDNTTVDRFPVSITTIGSRAFYDCTNLSKSSNALLSGTATTAAQLKNDADARLKNRTGFTSIGSEAFKGCAALMNVKLYNGSCDIADDVFDERVCLYSVTGSPVNTYATNHADKMISFIDIYDGKALQKLTGTSGDLTWQYEYATGKLTFAGTGEMADYSLTDRPEWNKVCVLSVVFSSNQTNVGNYAFYDNDRIATVTLPANIGCVGSHAFYDCDNLNLVTLSKTAKGTWTIGDYAFTSCGKLNRINAAKSTIGTANAVWDIGKYAFAHTALTQLTLYSANVDVAAFYDIKTLTVLQLLHTTMNVKPVAFADNTALTTLTANRATGDVVMSPYAFFNDTALVTINIGNNAAVLDFRGSQDSSFTSAISELLGISRDTSYQLFADSPLKTITLNCKEILYNDDGPFAQKDRIETVTLKNLTEIGKGLFKDCEALKTLNSNGALPTTLISINEDAFSGCKAIAAITIPNKVTYIGSSAFKDCTALKTVAFTNTSVCESIGESAFENCISLDSITGNGVKNSLPPSIKNLGKKAFYSCGLKTLISGTATPKTPLDNRTGLTSIGESAFGNCGYLGIFKLYNGSCDIKKDAFDEYLYLYSVTGSPAETYANKNNLMFRDIYGKEIKEEGDITPGNLHWAYTPSTGVLTFTKTDAKNAECYIRDFASEGMDIAPWRNYKVKIITYGSGVSLTYIGDYAFTEMPSLTAFTVQATVMEIGDYAFSGCSSMATLTNNVAAGKTLIIRPHAFEMCALTKVTNLGKATLDIGNYAFMANNMSSLTINAAIHIGNNAFSYAPVLKTVIVNGTNTTIGEYAFAGDSKLATVTLGSTGACSIHASAFADDSNITTLAFNNTKANWSIVSGEDFTSENMFKAAEQLSKVTIQCNIDDSFKYAFANKNELKTVTLSTLTKLPEGIFSNNIGLTAVSIPATVIRIDDKAFSKCVNLKNISIPASVTSIGKRAFEGCTALATLTFAGTSKCETIEEYAFNECTSLKTITNSSNTFPVSLKRIETHAFSKTALPNFTSGAKEGQGLEYIAAGAFADCDSLVWVKLYNGECEFGGTDALDDYMFVYSYAGGNVESYCRNTTWIFVSIIDPKSAIMSGTTGDLTWSYDPVKGSLTLKGKGRMADYSESNPAPWSYYRIVSVSLPSGLINIGDYAFDECTTITALTIPATVTSIGDHAFYGCTKLGAITIPNKVTAVDDYAFMNCTALKTLTFTSKSICTSIGVSAFENCESLTTITGDGKGYLPVSVEKLNDRAFYRCTSLCRLYSGKKSGQGLKTIGKEVFCGCDNFVGLYLWNGNCELRTDSFESDIVVYSIVGSKVYDFCMENDIIFMDITGKVTVIQLSGVSGDFTWTYDVNTKTLSFTIMKSRARIKNPQMADYPSSDATPWSKFKVKQVILPEKMAVIGSYAFANNPYLTSVTVPTTLTMIHDYAFYNCQNLNVKAADMLKRLGTNNNLQYGRMAMLLSPRIYNDEAGAPDVDVYQEVIPVKGEDLTGSGNPLDDDFYADNGIGKVNVRIGAKNAHEEGNGTDYVIVLDNTSSMLDNSFCTECGAKITSSGSGHLEPGCRGVAKTQWDITKEEAGNYAKMILADNPENRVSVVTMYSTYSVSTTTETETESVEGDDWDYWERERTVYHYTFTDSAVLANDFTNNKAQIVSAINKLQVDKIQGSVIYSENEYETVYGPWSEWSYHMAGPPGYSGPIGGQFEAFYGGGGGGSSSGGGGGGGGASVHTSSVDFEKFHPVKHERPNDFMPDFNMKVAAEYVIERGTDYYVTILGAMVNANSRKAPYNSRPVNMTFITDGKPISHARFVTGAGALARSYFDKVCTVGVCVDKTVKETLNKISTYSSNYGYYTFIIPEKNMQAVFEQAMVDIFNISSAMVDNVVLSSVLNTQIWHAITSVEDISGYEDIPNPEQYVTAGLDYSEDGSVVTRDFRKGVTGGKVGNGSGFSYYVQINDSCRGISDPHLLVTDKVFADYTILGGRYHLMAAKAEDDTPWYLPWSNPPMKYYINYLSGDEEIVFNPSLSLDKFDSEVTAIIKSAQDMSDTEEVVLKWSTSPDGSGKTYTPGQSYIMPASAYEGISLPEGVTLNEKGRPVLTLYAVWKGIGNNVYYDGLVESAVLSGDFDDIALHSVKVPLGNIINTDVNDYSARRLGWDFIGWTLERATTDIVEAGSLIKTKYETTLYAAYKRSLTLKLRSDITDFVDVDVPLNDIYNFDTQFKYSDSATEAEDGKYIVTFESNEGSELIDTESLDIDANGQATIPVTFAGWYSQLTGGVLLGTSGTGITVDVHEGEPYRYTVAGNSGSADMTSSDRTLTIYARHNTDSIRLPGSERSNDKFIGWFTHPQPSDGGTGYGGRYVGKQGDVVVINANITLYPWFNIPPVIIESELGSELHRGPLGDGFFEGQIMNYDRLLALIDTYDVDNPFEATSEYDAEKNNSAPNGYDGFVEWNGTKRWLDLYALNASVYLDELDEAYEWNLSPEEKEKILASVYDEEFLPSITGITYYEDGLDMNGAEYPEGVENVVDEQDYDGVYNRGLITDMYHVGKIVIHYEITDNGQFANGVKIMKGERNLAGGTFGVDSPITVGFDLVTYVNFNNPPKLKLTSTYMYTGDGQITKDNIEVFLQRKQDATDRCDDTDRKPWWYSTETKPALDESIKIMEVYDINFSSGYEIEYPEICNKVKEIKDIKKLFALKESNYETFKHITDFKVEWDCVDQWGKTASGYLMPGFDYSGNPNIDAETLVDWKPGSIRIELPGGQTKYGLDKDKRSITVIMFNNEDDYDLMKGNAVVSERSRYIDRTWSDYLSPNSYWGDNSKYGGKETLTEIFKKYEKTGNKKTVKGAFDNNGRSVNIIINDYSDNTETP